MTQRSSTPRLPLSPAERQQADRHAAHALWQSAQGYLDAGQVTLAEMILREGIQTLGGAQLHGGLAAALSARGDMDGAMTELRTALKADPHCLQAWQLLTSIHTFGEDDAFLRKARRLSRDAATPPALRRALGYLQSKAADDRGAWGQAWDHAHRASRIDTPAYDPASLRRFVAEQRDALDGDLIARLGAPGAVEARPVFIVGMPRSGTSLMERLLATRLGLTACGEVPTLRAMLHRKVNAALRTGRSHDWLGSWTADEIAADRAEYSAAIATRVPTGASQPFVDKMPGNLLCLPLIGVLFPRAPIIRMHRDARDTCVSCFLGEFSGGNNFAYRTEWLAEAWHLYQEAGDAAEAAIPNPVHHIRYEELVSDCDGVMDQLAAALGPAGATSGSAVHPYSCVTRSRGQVWAPVSTRSVGRWQRYGDRVTPLRDALTRFASPDTDTNY